MSIRSGTSAPARTAALPAFCDGIQYLGEPWPDFDTYAGVPVIADGQTAVADTFDPAAVFQTLLAADALRYLALQITGEKASGHPGGFASSAEIYASLIMLGHVNILTEAGHHAPGFYAALFLDTSLERMGIRTVRQLRDRYRERDGLLGHPSAAIAGILAPAGPLGQGQHFAMAGALLNRDVLFPLTLGDGGMGEPYVLSSMMHFHLAYPDVTNFLPVLVWNGYSQEHHSMVSRLTNDEMIAHWKGHGFEDVVLVDAKAFDDQHQEGPYVDSTRLSLARRLAFAGAVLQGLDRAAKSAMAGRLTAVIVKQIKGAGVHKLGAKSHNLTMADTLNEPLIVSAMKRRALNPDAWVTVRENFRRAGGGAAASVSVIESPRAQVPLGRLPMQDFPVGSLATPTTALGAMVAAVGRADRNFVMTNADGNEACGLKDVNEALGIRHPTPDPLYNQRRTGQIYEPVNEDACAGLAVGLALFGGRSLWLSYESFAVNGLPIWQTATQALAELRRQTPSAIAVLTAGALEQGRNGWTHQRPEIEGYLMAMVRNGNVFVLFPADANMTQAAYEWALETSNKGVLIVASKGQLPVHTTLQQGREALAEGACVVYESEPGSRPVVVLAVVGDLMLQPALAATDILEQDGYRVRIVSVVNPRRLYRPCDIAWDRVAERDGRFMSDTRFAALFDGEALLAIAGGSSAPIEPLLLRTSAPRRDVLAWKRGETTATSIELMGLNDLGAEAVVARVRKMMTGSRPA